MLESLRIATEDRSSSRLEANAFHGPTIRVLHVYRTFFPDPPGGVQEAIRQLCQATAQYGVESTVFCLAPNPSPKRLEMDGFTIWRARSWAAPASCDLGGPEAWRDFSRLAREHDIIHYHFPWPFADALHLTVRPKAKTILTYHSDIVRQEKLLRPYRPIMWRMLQSMDAIVATSPAYARTSRVLSDPRISERVQVIPLGIKDQSSTDELEPESEELGGEPYILFVGALRYYKGLRNLLQAAPAVKAKILIAGEGPELPVLSQMAAALKLQNIEFLGPVSEETKLRLLSGCRAVVLPSHLRSEAFGVALIEAARQSRAMVSCEVGSGTSFVNLHDKTGLVVEPSNPPQLASALNRLIEDKALALQFGRAARERYKALFSADHLGAAHSRLYRAVMN